MAINLDQIFRVEVAAARWNYGKCPKAKKYASPAGDDCPVPINVGQADSAVVTIAGR